MSELKELDEETAGKPGDSFADFEDETGKQWNLKKDEDKEELEDRIDNNNNIESYNNDRYPQGV